jgi:multidrug resistance efflux pump
MMCKKLLFRLSLRSFWYRVLPILLLTLIPMGLLSQNSEPRLNNSNAILQTWEQISGTFQSELTALRQDLQMALNDAKQSKTSLQKLTVLYEISLTRITNLEVFNDQIGQRIQESDEWNAELQDENVKLEAKVKVARANGLRNTIIAGVGGIVLGLLIPVIIKLLRLFRIIP